MANNAAGEIVCPVCGGVDEVRQNAKGKFYIYCEQFGIIQPARPAFQVWIKERATMYGDGKEYNGGPEPKPEPETPETAPAAPASSPEPPPAKKSGLLGRLGRAILEE